MLKIVEYQESKMKGTVTQLVDLVTSKGRRTG